MRQISTNELREMYQAFFESKGHVRISSAPLVPEHDPSVLFTTAGMHPLVPYLKGQPHPAGKRLTDVQKSLRTTDIESVGDATHATVFEMLGNWSLGDYFKKEAIAWSWQFLTSKEWLGIDPNYLAVSVFAGDADAPRDDQSATAWKSLGVSEERIAYLGKEDNWWPAYAEASAGQAPLGPQGPDTEMFFWSGEEKPPEKFDTADKNWVEIWNDVFMQFNRTPEGKYESLPQQNVDTGMGLERTVMILNGLKSIYEVDSFVELMKLIRGAVKKPDQKHERILADHIKSATFILSDEHPVEPSNVERGYVLRRIIRRAVRSARALEISDTQKLMMAGIDVMVKQYGKSYPSLQQNQMRAKDQLIQEIVRFESALERGLREFTKMITGMLKGEVISGAHAFLLYETFGFPIELTQELAREHGLTIDMGGFEEALKQHQTTSRAGSEQKFKGGLADHSDMSTKYHTATHLLHQALRTILGEHVFQKGSNITPERLRFDFSHPEKMTPEQIQTVETLINEKIKADLPVTREEMTVEEAKKRGALGLFEHKYGEQVSVYTINDFSCEICGGPHVEHTGALGHFKITKEESASSGVRRIKAVLE